ncbi:MAG: NAD-dependent epimerase/dehydratase family protein [Bdellovibrionota bacterium]
MGSIKEKSLKQANLRPLPLADLEHVLEHSQASWVAHRNARIFLTGGTGFFGKWLCASFAHANRELGLGATLTVLTRDPSKTMPFPSVEYVQGDVRSFSLPVSNFTHVIHAATPVEMMGNPERALEILDVCYSGTASTLEIARSSKARTLLVSSGGIYGPTHLDRIPETYCGGPDSASLAAAYNEGKRIAETLLHIQGEVNGLDHSIARCFAFVGPHLPLEGSFAAGQFMKSALESRPIEISGSGLSSRSYLHTADLTIWLWTILFEGKKGSVFNVGSDEPVTITELGAKIARLAGQTPPLPQNRPGTDSRYIPDITKAKTELGLQVRIPLDRALERTFDWLKAGV